MKHDKLKNSNKIPKKEDSEITISVERFYMLDKSLQLIEGTNVAAFWGHLVDTYNYFADKEKADFDGVIYQSSKVIQAFTGISLTAQRKARIRLKELKFLDYFITTKPGEATKTTFYVLNKDGYLKWYQEHEFDELRKSKYEKLQNPEDTKRLNDWVKKSKKKLGIQADTNNGKKQMSKREFANVTNGDLQTSQTEVCNTPKEDVIDNKEIDTKIENKLIEGNIVVYSGEKFVFLEGKSNQDIAKLIVDSYSSAIKPYISVDSPDYDEDRYIGDLNEVEKAIESLEIDVAVNYYVGILGYLYQREIMIPRNPKALETSHKLENLIKHNVRLITTLDNMRQGEMKYIQKHQPKVDLPQDPLKSL